MKFTYFSCSNIYFNINIKIGFTYYIKTMKYAFKTVLINKVLSIKSSDFDVQLIVERIEAK